MLDRSLPSLSRTSGTWGPTTRMSNLGGPRSCDSRSRSLRCSPADFDLGSDRGYRDGWCDESTFRIVDINSFAGCSACGYVGEGEHFPAFRAGSGSGGSTAGRRSRSSTYPQAFLVNSSRCAIAEALVLTLIIVEADPGANAGFRLGHRRIGMEVDLFVFEAAPQSLDEDVVHGELPLARLCPLSVHNEQSSCRDIASLL